MDNVRAARGREGANDNRSNERHEERSMGVKERQAQKQRPETETEAEAVRSRVEE